MIQIEQIIDNLLPFDQQLLSTWKGHVLSACGVTHDRDVNAAKGILSAWRCSTSSCGNESSPSVAPPSQASRLREARISARKAAA
jgi:hypothetical protein